MAVATRSEKKASSTIALRPLGDRLLVMVDDKETVSPGGIVLPDAAQERPSKGIVIAAGRGVITDAGRREMEVAEGDRIWFARFAGQDIVVGEDANGKDVTVKVLKQDDVLAVLEKSA